MAICSRVFNFASTAPFFIHRNFQPPEIRQVSSECHASMTLVMRCPDGIPRLRFQPGVSTQRRVAVLGWPAFVIFYVLERLQSMFMPPSSPLGPLPNFLDGRRTLPKNHTCGPSFSGVQALPPSSRRSSDLQANHHILAAEGHPTVNLKNIFVGNGIKRPYFTLPLTGRALCLGLDAYLRGAV